MKKIICAALFALLLLGAVGCRYAPEQSPKSYEEQKSLYNDVISQYTTLLTALHNGEALSAPDTSDMNAREKAISETLYGVVAACKTAEEAENWGYGYMDMDGNGTPELILLSKYTPIRAIFTLSKNQPVLLESAYDSDSSLQFAARKRFLLCRTTASGNTYEVTRYTCRVDGDKMVYDSVCGEVYDSEKKEVCEYFQVVNGSRTQIDKSTYLILSHESRKAQDMDYITVAKLEAPLVHLPLVESKENPDLPVADFSSYAAIRNTYTAISRCLEDFERRKWETGEYDRLFSFPNDRAYEFYSKLLRMAYSVGQPMGYDEIDLNGDGLDELVLMSENYRIKAIFTQKDGVPELVDAFAYPGQFAWLDRDGLIHVDTESYYILMYSRYEFTKSGEYRHRDSVVAYSSGSLYDSGRYLIRDGKTEPISLEDSLDYRHNEYVCYSEPFGPNEFTRSVSKLTYTPLVEATEDMVKAAAEKTWHKNADLEKTSGKDMAGSNTYVTFENPTDTQMDMHIRYVFYFPYPDPDRDNYLLEDVTESTLQFSVRNENGAYVFDGNGIQGKIEFGQEALWLIVENSSDERFPVGYYCHEHYVPETTEE